jgi:hypothetical protein
VLLVAFDPLPARPELGSQAEAAVVEVSEDEGGHLAGAGGAIVHGGERARRTQVAPGEDRAALADEERVVEAIEGGALSARLR